MPSLKELEYRRSANTCLKGQWLGAVTTNEDAFKNNVLKENLSII